MRFVRSSRFLKRKKDEYLEKPIKLTEILKEAKNVYKKIELKTKFRLNILHLKGLFLWQKLKFRWTIRSIDLRPFLKQLIGQPITSKLKNGIMMTKVFYLHAKLKNASKHLGFQLVSSGFIKK